MSLGVQFQYRGGNCWLCCSSMLWQTLGILGVPQPLLWQTQEAWAARRQWESQASEKEQAAQQWLLSQVVIVAETQQEQYGRDRWHCRTRGAMLPGFHRLQTRP